MSNLTYEIVRLGTYFGMNLPDKGLDSDYTIKIDPSEVGLFKTEDKSILERWKPNPEPEDINQTSASIKPKIASCVTMYNETPDQLMETLNRMAQNFDYIENAEIFIIVIVDGLEQFLKMPQEHLEQFKVFFNISMMNSLLDGTYDSPFSSINKIVQNIDKNIYPSIQVQSHWNHIRSLDKKEIMMKYEYGHLFSSNYKGYKTFFLVKHLNKRKLNSHLWFFSGFCRELNPNYCFLIDVGTLVLPYALNYLFEELHCGSLKEPYVAGVCGEIIPIMAEATFTDVMIHAQKVEYKFSHILDKALESVLGFITVLPGAFSGYNYKCLEPDNLDGPLWGHYFYSLKMKGKISCYKANIYLAEDRILCSALVFSNQHCNILKYSSKAKAETDVPKSMFELLSQRRRWINGSWFALLHSLSMIKTMSESKHSCCRKLIFYFQMLYYLINIVYSFFLVGGFYLALSICVRQQFESKTVENDRNFTGNLLILFYLAQLLLLLILSLGTQIKNVEYAFSTISVIFSCYMLVFILLLIGIIMKNFNNSILIIFFIGTAAAFALILLVNNCMFHIIISIVHFIIATPTYVNIFIIYAMCNIHDVTWGNRPDKQTQDELSKLEDFKKFRTSWVLLWALTNGFLAYLLDALDSKSSKYGGIVYLVGIFGIIGLIIRFLGGMAYIFCCKNRDIGEKIIDANKIKEEEEEDEDEESQDYSEIELCRAELFSNEEVKINDIDVLVNSKFLIFFIFYKEIKCCKFESMKYQRFASSAEMNIHRLQIMKLNSLSFDYFMI